MHLLYDTENPKAVDLHSFLAERINLKDGDENICIVLGGDGFMLRSIRSHYRAETVFLGLNCGAVGFLLNEVPTERDAVVESIQEEKFSIRNFPRIEMACTDLSGQSHSAAAVNDIYLERMTGQTVHFRLQINEITVIEKLVCDGIILSTALGSTAYNFSASGAVCHPNLGIISVTPICPHSPRLGSVILPIESTIELEALSPENRQAQAVADGVVFQNVVRMSVTCAAEGVQLAFLDGHDYTAAMFQKVLLV